MSNRLTEFIEKFPWIVGLPKDAYIVGGTARYLLGRSDNYPKDIDIRCGTRASYLDIRKKPELAYDQDNQKNSLPGSVVLTDGDMGVDLWYYKKSPDIRAYLNHVPLSNDGCAVRVLEDGHLLAVTSPDFWGPVKQRTGKVIKSASFRTHVEKGLSVA